MRCIDDHEARRRRKKVSGVMHVGCVLCGVWFGGVVLAYLSAALKRGSALVLVPVVGYDHDITAISVTPSWQLISIIRGRPK